MAIHNAPDFGYSPKPAPDVRIGDLFRQRCAIGVSEHRVVRRHRDAGYFETVFVRWVTAPDHSCRHSARGSIEVRARRDILDLMLAA